MYKPLVSLEEANLRARIELTKTLANQCKVTLATGYGGGTGEGSLGLAFYFAYDPWMTCLRCPPGSVRFFHAAEKSGLISNQDAYELASTLLEFGRRAAADYDGRFGSFFSEPQIKTIFNNVDNLKYLSESALAIAGDWVDCLFQACPFPIDPSKHLHLQDFRQLASEEEIEFYSQSRWLSWIEALDLVCLGAWAGLTPSSILSMVKALEERVGDRLSHARGVENSFVGQKVRIPVYTRGLQGVVVGFFVNTPKCEADSILNTLVQFGGALADVYADFRWTAFVEALGRDDLTDNELAREVVNVVSPVSKVIVTREGRHTGYKIHLEENYWAGYQPLTDAALNVGRSPVGFAVDGPRGSEIFIEPLADVPDINLQFMRIRLENNLKRAFNSVLLDRGSDPLSFGEVERLYSKFEGHKKDDHTSLAKLRQYYVIGEVKNHWDDGRVTVANNDLKKFMERELGHEVKNGYQVTSYASELHKIFNKKVRTKKEGNALALSWSKIL